MGAYHLRGSHLKLIARQHARYSVRGGAGLVFTFITLAAGLLIAGIFLDMVGGMTKSRRQQGEQVTSAQVLSEVVSELGRPAVKKFVGDDKAQIDYLVDKKPALVSAVLVMLMFFLPFLVGLGSFNQLSGDIGSKGLRYLLPRTERANLFIGRFIGTYLFVAAVLALLVGIVLLYLVAALKYYPAGEVTLWMLQGYLAMIIVALPYVAFCSWFSAMVDAPFGTFALTQVVIALLPIVVRIAELFGADPRIDYANYVMPWPWKYKLLHPDPLQFLLGTAVMVGFTGVFLVLGARHFQTRDL